MGRRKQFEREEVLDRSIDLFWRKGFADTSLHDLELATGVNKSGLYSEFADKEDIFVKSLARYTAKNGVIETLNRKPLGRKNLEDFLTAAQKCPKQKGCFITNSIRECSILPDEAERFIKNHMDTVLKAISANLKAIGKKRRVNLLAEQILTYNAGLALSLNLGDKPNIESMVKHFLDALL